jgi:hypothetical protein
MASALVLRPLQEVAKGNLMPLSVRRHDEEPDERRRQHIPERFSPVKNADNQLEPYLGRPIDSRLGLLQDFNAIIINTRITIITGVARVHSCSARAKRTLFFFSKSARTLTHFIL